MIIVASGRIAFLVRSLPRPSLLMFLSAFIVPGNEGAASDDGLDELAFSEFSHGAAYGQVGDAVLFGHVSLSGQACAWA